MNRSPERRWRFLKPTHEEQMLVRAHRLPDGPFKESAARFCLNVEMWFNSKAALERFLRDNEGEATKNG